MPIHDWTRVDTGLFHDFHQGWTVALRNALNGGVLPPDYFALVEQRISGPIADVLTLALALVEQGIPGRSGDVLTREWARAAAGDPTERRGGVAVPAAPPRTDLPRRT